MTCKNCIHCYVCELMDDDKYDETVCAKIFKDKNKIIELPCKVGDTVYFHNEKLTVDTIRIANDGVFHECFLSCDYLIEKYGCEECPFADLSESNEGEYDCDFSGFFIFTNDDIGKTVFLTKAEAEQKLKELSENETNKNLCN